jgi:hypothetical protein
MLRTATAAAALVAAIWWIGGKVKDDREWCSITYDEPLHIVGGWSYWKLDDYRLHPTNGVLIQRWLTLPYHFADLRTGPEANGSRSAALPSLDGQEFRRATKLGEDFGKRFLFQSGNESQKAVDWARSMGGLLAVLLLATTLAASRWMLPGILGLLPIAALAFCPNMLAHSGLATSDVGAAFGFLSATFCWARLLQRITLWRLFWSVVSWGILFGIKMSAGLILPIAVIAALPMVFNRRPWRFRIGEGAGWARNRSIKAVMLLLLLVVHLFGAAAMVWSYYGFRYSAFATYEEGKDGFPPPWEQVLDGLGSKGKAIQFAREHRLLPEAYLYGFAHTLKFSQQRPAFLNGRYSQTGWWYYFPLVFLMKTPLPTLGLFLLTASWGLRRLAATGNLREKVSRSRTIARAWPFLVLIGIYFVVACTSNLNIGYRHLLPILPPLFVLIGGLELARLPIRIVAWLLVGWLAVESFTARPHYLAYFNQLAGGRENGYRRLSDSNVDWGQDLPALAKWQHELRSRGDKGPLYLAYFGVDEVGRFNIDAKEPLVGDPNNLEGWYCISATIITAPSRGKPPWGDVEERQYQEMLAVDPKSLPAEQAKPFDERLARAKQWRMFAGLWKRTPDANLGGSILAYRLSDDDARNLIFGLPPHRSGNR